MDRPTFVPAVFYKDPLAALKFLEKAFGFEVAALVVDAEGNLAHSEMTFRGGALSVGGEWSGPPIGPARMRSPANLDGIGTQFIRINLTAGLDAHCEHARANGADIVSEPEDQFYGARTYRALDPEGHVWTFSLDVAPYDAAAAEEKLGFKTVTSLAAAGHG